MHGRTLLLVVWSERARGQLQRRFLLPVGFKLCIGHRPLSRGFVLPHTRGMCSVRGGNSVGGGRHIVLSVPGQHVCICQRADCVHCMWSGNLFWKRIDIMLESDECVRHRSCVLVLSLHLLQTLIFSITLLAYISNRVAFSAYLARPDST